MTLHPLLVAAVALWLVSVLALRDWPRTTVARFLRWCANSAPLLYIAGLYFASYAQRWTLQDLSDVVRVAWVFVMLAWGMDVLMYLALIRYDLPRRWGWSRE